MGKTSLGRVLDPKALDASAGPRARLRVQVPAAWLAEGADLVVTAPARLACARCEGGGCDSCARSGALRAPESAGARVVRTRVPVSDRAIAVRIPRPFGADHAIEQLLLEVALGASPSAGVARMEHRVVRVDPDDPPASRRAPVILVWLPLAAVVVAAALISLFGR